MNLRFQLPLINTPLQRGDLTHKMIGNRFSGFRDVSRFAEARETAEAVQVSYLRRATPLKRGVNERHRSAAFSSSRQAH